MKRVAIYIIKALLGHARLSVTSHYIAAVDNVLLASAEKLSMYIQGAMSGTTGHVITLPNRASG